MRNNKNKKQKKGQAQKTVINDDGGILFAANEHLESAITS